MASNVHEIAELWARGDEHVARQVVAPVAEAYVRGYVESFDVGKASIHVGARDTPATPGFDVPAWLRLSVGDYVLCRNLGSDRVVLMVLDRNASIDQFANPLTTPGQIIIMGADGTPTVIEPPANPLLSYQLVWDPVSGTPAWVAV